MIEFRGAAGTAARCNGPTRRDTELLLADEPGQTDTVSVGVSLCQLRQPASACVSSCVSCVS